MTENKTLPTFNSTEELADFFDANDMGDYDLPEAQFEVDIQTREFLLPRSSASILPILKKTAVDAKEYLAEWGDVALEVATDSTVLEKVPLISTAMKIWSIQDKYHQHRLKRNVVAFLNALKDSNSDEVQSLFEAATHSEELDDFVDTAFSILIDAEKPIKSELLGRLLDSASKGKLNLSELNDLSQIIYSSSVPALKSLPMFFSRSGGKADVQNLSVMNEGLLISLGVGARSGTKFSIAPLGQKLFEFGFPL